MLRDALSEYPKIASAATMVPSYTPKLAGADGIVRGDLPLFDALLEEPDILAGNYDIHWLENWLSTFDD